MSWRRQGAILGLIALGLLGYVAWIALLVFLRYPSAVWACELARLC